MILLLYNLFLGIIRKFKRIKREFRTQNKIYVKFFWPKLPSKNTTKNLIIPEMLGAEL